MDEAAAATYAANFANGDPDHVHAGTIQEWGDDMLPDRVDVILGGPPCQGFSSLNKNRTAGDERNSLWREYVRVVHRARPKAFVIENVATFLKSPEYEALEAEADDGLLKDYELNPGLLVAANYGVPQKRKRTIVIATHKDLPRISHPRPTHRDPLKSARSGKNADPDGLFPVEGKGAVEGWVSINDIFASTDGIALEETELPDDLRWTPPGSARSFPGRFSTTQLHIRRNPKPESVERYKAIPPGGNRHNLTGKFAEIGGKSVYLSTTSWDAHRTGSGDVMGRMHLDRPSVTIRTEFYKPEKGRYLHPYKHRPITHMEAAYLQGFPPEYLWCGSKNDIARQIGNAVPIGLGRALAQAIYEGIGADM